MFLTKENFTVQLPKILEKLNIWENIEVSFDDFEWDDLEISSYKNNDFHFFEKWIEAKKLLSALRS